MAGVRKGKDGQWFVDFRWQGNRISRRVDEEGHPIADRDHAERTHRALLHKLETGQTIAAARHGPRPKKANIVEALSDDGYTVGQACLAYMELSTRKASFDDVARSCRMWIELFGDRPIDSVTSLDVELAMEKRAAASSNSTANHDLAYLRASVRKALHAGMAHRDPTAGVKKLPAPPPRTRWMRPTEGVDLWAHLVDPQDRRLVVVIVNTGLRRGNACALEWTWVDFDRARIEIPRTKSGKALSVPLNSVALAALREQHELSGTSRWVWLGARGGPINARTWWRHHLRPALVAAGMISDDEDDSGKMPAFRTHDLRHTFGSRATAAGVHLQATQELLGHSSVQVTERYSHLDDDALRAASEAMAWHPPTATAPPSVPPQETDGESRE